MAEKDRIKVEDVKLIGVKPLKTGKDKPYWILKFPEGNEAKTFSSTAGEAFTSAVGKTLKMLELEETKPYNDQKQYKPVMAILEDGSVLYDASKDQQAQRGGGGGGGRGGPPDWSMRTPEERAEERESIERQVSLKSAVEVAVHSDKDFTASEIVSMAGEFATFIRPERSGSEPGASRRGKGVDGGEAIPPAEPPSLPPEPASLSSDPDPSATKPKRPSKSECAHENIAMNEAGTREVCQACGLAKKPGTW